MSGLLLGMVLSVCTCWFHSLVTFRPRVVSTGYYYYYYYYYNIWRRDGRTDVISVVHSFLVTWKTLQVHYRASRWVRRCGGPVTPSHALADTCVFSDLDLTMTQCWTGMSSRLIYWYISTCRLLTPIPRWDVSVDAVSGLRIVRSRNRVCSQHGPRDFFFVPGASRPLLGPSRLFYLVGTGDCCHRRKRPQREAKRFPLCGEIRSAWSSTTILPYVLYTFIVWCVINHRDNF
jgi:hypothetical protein